MAPNLTQNCNEKNSILFLSSMFSSWRKDQWVPVPEPILDLVTSLNQKARPSVALQAFLPVCAVCARALCAEPHGREGSVERAPRSGARKPCACSESFFREHTAQLPSWNPSSDPHSSPTERRGEARKPRDRNFKALCWSDVLVLLE